MMRFIPSFLILFCLKLFAKSFWRHEVEWIGEVQEDPWVDFRIVVVLNHTSLFEWLFAGSVPNRFLWRIVTHGLVPAADITLNRPLVGRFFKWVVPNLVSITREPDHTWRAVLRRAESDTMVLIFPEGRMKRGDGLDKRGRPMTVRGGIADLLKAMPKGRMLLAYSAGLHHIQVPGQRLPKLFRTTRIIFESVDIEDFKAESPHGPESADFKSWVKQELERRRELYCPPGPGNP
jgi:1-acyl-sn-glycerol-3-phosphate acyltransferase